MKVQSKKDAPYIIKVNSRDQAREVINHTIKLGFKNDSFWNEDQLNDPWYDENLDSIFIHLDEYIQMHNHAKKETISFEEWQSLPDIPKPEYEPKDVAFNQRKIVGYKLIKPEYKEAVREISKNGDSSWFDNFDSNLIESGYNFVFCDLLNSVHNQLETAGVMHWFEPVYKKESITLKSGVKLSEDDITEVKEILNNK